MLKFAYILLPLLFVSPLTALGDETPAASPTPTVTALDAEGAADQVVDADADGKGIFSPNVINLVYLIAAVMFIRGIKGLTHPRTAVRGNLLAAVGMLVAVVVTLGSGGLSPWSIAAGLLVGGAYGAYKAVKVK